MEHVHVERVAFDPFAAVEEPPQSADLRVDTDTEQRLEGMHGTHLVGNRADAADAGDDVDHLVGRAPHDQLLEVARRLEDAEPRLDHLAVADAQGQ